MKTSKQPNKSNFKAKLKGIQAKFKAFWSKIKANKKLIIGSLISAVVYTLILGSFGVFGDTLKKGIMYFMTDIVPYIAMAFGYFMAVFLPIRISQALARNKEIREDRAFDKKLSEHANKSHELQENILKALKSNETFK